MEVTLTARVLLWEAELDFFSDRDNFQIATCGGLLRTTNSFIDRGTVTLTS